MRVPAATVSPLLLEIGCEEIPARFLAAAEKDLASALQAALRQARLLDQAAPALQSYSTPRRLVVYAQTVLTNQPTQVEEVVGPPSRVALNGEGRFTRAAESFAEKHGARLQDLARVPTPKGEYLALRIVTRGRPARLILPELLPTVIGGLTFPKSMYWLPGSGVRFVRPIRWILALLGAGKRAKVVRFEYAGVTSADVTYGHRALGKRPVQVRSFDDYRSRLLARQVEISPPRRRQEVVDKSKVLLEKKKLRPVPDENLLDWIVNSTEWPQPSLGGFEARFLRLPREILVTVMRDHQKYFAVENAEGALEPYFVPVLNLEPDARGLIAQRHAQVLAARFADAEFFWEADQRTPLTERGELLTRMTYEVNLGSYADKVRRMLHVSRLLCDSLGRAGKLQAESEGWVAEAVGLAKCDLTTQMVQEFPELQGVVGGLYAQAQRKHREVSQAIYDHYLPESLEDRCPRSLMGAVVSLADKMEAVLGGFAVGHEPTGSSDPFALRRQANSIIKVLLEFTLPIDLRWLAQQALPRFQLELRHPEAEVLRRLHDFFSERLRYYLETVRGLRYDTVRAVLAAGSDAPLDAQSRAEALESLRGSEDLEALCVAAKRIKNILSKSATSADWSPGEIDPALLSEGGEFELFGAFGEVATSAESLRKAGETRLALEAIASLRPAVDRFFDQVLVMAEDPAVRRNRLRLLAKLDALFSAIAQFAEIAAPHVGAPTMNKVKGEE